MVCDLHLFLRHAPDLSGSPGLIEDPARTAAGTCNVEPRGLAVRSRAYASVLTCRLLTLPSMLVSLRIRGAAVLQDNPVKRICRENDYRINTSRDSGASRTFS